MERVGHQLASVRGLTYMPATAGNYEKGIDQHITGLKRDDGSIERTLGRIEPIAPYRTTSGSILNREAD